MKKILVTFLLLASSFCAAYAQNLAGGYDNGLSSGGTGAPGGSTTQVQYNNSGALGGNSGFIYVNNNVGIGTTTPGTALDVGTGVVRAGGFATSGSGAGKLFGPNGIQVDPNNSTSDGSSFVPKLVVTSGGNVGIGTSTAANALVVAGTAEMTGIKMTTSPAAGDVLVSTSVGIGTWMTPASIGSGGGGGSGTVTSSTINQVAKFAATGSTVQGSTILFDDATNVGVGTSVPATLFDVNRKFNVLSGGNIGIGTLLPEAGLVVNAGGAVIRGTGNTMLNPSTGNVGIGTASPNYAGLTIGSARGIQAVGIGTTVPQQLCRDAIGRVGYFNGAWASSCTVP